MFDWLRNLFRRRRNGGLGPLPSGSRPYRGRSRSGLIARRGARRRGPDERWRPYNEHPDSSIARDVELLRARSRELAISTSLGAAFLERLEADVVGLGITPISDARFANGQPHESFNAQADDLWEQMASVIDHRQVMDMTGITSMALRCWAESGAVLLHMVTPEDPRLPVPLQVYGIEPDYLEGDGLTSDGNELRRGVEVERTTGRIVAFHVRESPVRDFSAKVKRIPASECLYAFRAQRWGQVLGAPWMEPALEDIWGLADYDYSEQVRAREFSKRSHYVKTKNPQARIRNLTTAALRENADGTTSEERVETISSGRTYLGPDEEPVFAEANVPSSTYAAFKVAQTRSIAAGLGFSYEWLIGDYTKTHFSAARAVRMRDIASIRRIQAMLVQRILRPLRERMILYAVMNGSIGVSLDRFLGDPAYRWRLLRCRFRGPSIPWHDPKVDVSANVEAIRLGIKSRADIVLEQGGIFEDTIDQLAYEQEYIRKRLGAPPIVDPTVPVGGPKQPLEEKSGKAPTNGNGRLQAVLSGADDHG